MYGHTGTESVDFEEWCLLSKLRIHSFYLWPLLWPGICTSITYLHTLPWPGISDCEVRGNKRWHTLPRPGGVKR